MERSKYIFCLLICIILAKPAAFGQSQYKQGIYDAYISGDLAQWESIMNQMESTELSVESTLELLSYYYGYIGYMVSNNQSKKANVYIKRGEKLIDGILDNHPENATALAYKGSFTAFKMMLNKIKAVTLGPQSMKHINKAYKLDPSDVQALTDKGNVLFYAPAIFGGSKKESIGYYETAISQMEANNDTRNWFYLCLNTILAQHLEDLDRKDEARVIYEKILAIEPNFKWVKDELYPALLGNENED